MSTSRSKVLASSLALALVVATMPSFAASAPAAARLTGTVYGEDVTTPLAGATVIATDSNGVKIASQPTQSDGSFTIAAVTPGRTSLSLETKSGTFAVATPVTLAPGEARGVQLALKGGKAKGGHGSSGASGGSGYSAGAITAMTVVIVGFVAAAAAGVNQSNDNSASPFEPGK